MQVEGGAFSTTALSRGERMRLALLTAYLEDRPSRSIERLRNAADDS